jgi:hypothetical protein
LVSYEFEFVFFENLINKTTVISIFTGSFRNVFLFCISQTTIFLLLLFVNKSKTSTWKISQQQHRFVYKLYGFCCSAYQNKEKKNRHLFLLCLGLAYNKNEGVQIIFLLFLTYFWIMRIIITKISIFHASIFFFM